MKTGVEIIAQERAEQISKHRWLPSHDDMHTDGSLRVVAAVLACDGTDAIVSDPLDRGSEFNHWGLREKLTGDDNRVHRLAVAGALIAAEIDRINRESKRRRSRRAPDCMD